MGKSAGALVNPRVLLSVVCAALFVGAGYPLLMPAQGRRSSLTLTEAERRKRDALTKLRAVDSQRVHTRSALYRSQQDLAAAEASLDQARAACDDAQRRLVETTMELRRAEAKLRGHQEEFADRLAEMHQGGEISFLDVLLGSESFADFANQLYIAQLIVQDDIDLLQSLEDDREQVARMQRQVRIEARRAANYRDLVAARQAEVARTLAQQQAELTALLRDKRRYEQEYDKWLGLAKELAAEIPRRSKNYPVAAWTGRLKPPVGGAITSGFGMRFHPIWHKWKMHTGVDIGAKSGTPIRASGDGVVIYTGRRGGYGETVMISHGGGISTLYAHCYSNSIRVYEGQKVKQGDTIARVGATGLATGPHVHFEVRVNGKCVDPVKYCTSR